MNGVHCEEQIALAPESQWEKWTILVNFQYILRKEVPMFSLNVAHKNLYFELKKYEKLGVSMVMNGHIASPLQIVQAHMIREAGAYMRDYEMNSEGGLKTLAFHEVRFPPPKDKSKEKSKSPSKK